jgi:hypothetical protein
MSARELDALDRHALVMAIWLPLVLVAATAFHYGFAADGWPFISAGFVVLLAAFIGHVIVNIVFETRFTASEVALGLVTYCVSVLGFGLAMLLSSSAQRLYAVPVTLGLLGMASAIVVTMILWLGLRGAFESFDVIRRFRP